MEEVSENEKDIKPQGPELVVVGSWVDTCEIEQLCRACASSSTTLIKLFEDEGVQHDLAVKFNKHLPIKVAKDDKLPKNMCYTCASTLISFHDLVKKCLDSDIKLKSLLNRASDNSKNLDDDDDDDEIYEQCVEDTYDEDDDADQNPEDSNDFIAPEVPNKNVIAETIACRSSSGTLPIMKSNVVHTDLTEEILEGNDNDVDMSTDPLDLNESTEIIEPDPAVPSTSKAFIVEVPTTETDTSKRTKLPQIRIQRKRTSQSLVETTLKTLICSGDTTAVKKSNSKLNNRKISNLKVSKVKANKLSCKADGTRKYKSKPSVKNSVLLYKCKSCSESFILFSEFKSHLLSHKKLISRTEKVNENEKSVSGNSSLGNEFYIDADKEGLSGTTSKLLSDVKKEVVELAQRDRSLHCNKCEMAFDNIASLRRHMKTHKSKTPYICHKCGKEFIRSGSYSYHIHHVHLGIKNHQCTVCSRSFSQKHFLADHMRIHTGERPFICDLCGKTFKTSASLYTHKRSHTDDFPFPCSMCERKFRTRQHCVNHFVIHTGEKKIQV